MKKKVIFHIDVNNAFLSWTAVDLLEKGFEKDIRKIPAVIGGDEKKRHGIVLAKSPVAKKYNIVTAETLYSARKKCAALEIYPPNHKLYSKKSKELMEYLTKYSPSIEKYSIDECFLDMSGMNYLYKDLVELAHNIKDDIKKKFKYTVNIGIANNKLCAKMASDFEKPDKVHTLFSDEIVTKLWPLDVVKLFMCGKKTTEELHKLNIHTIEELAKKDEKFLKQHFKNQGEYLKQAALGKDLEKVEKKKVKNPSISTSTTLSYNYNDPDKLKEIIFTQTEELTRQLRSKKLFTKTIGVIFKNSNFISYSAQTTLETPTNNTKEIIKAVYEVFDNNYKGDDIRLIGVRLTNLDNEKRKQVSLFNLTEEKNDNDIQKTIDEINSKFGKSLINPAVIKKIKDIKK